MSKIGRKSLGLLLLLIGGIFLAQQWSNVSFVAVFGFVWPILFVGIILETIYYYRSKEPSEHLQFDKGAMIILILSLVVSASLQTFQQNGIGMLQGFSLDWQDNGLSVPFEESYDLTQEVEEIHFNIPNGRLRIEGTDEEQILLNGTIKANKSSDSEVERLFEKSRKTEVSDNIFQYRVEQPKSSWFFWNEYLKVDFVISLPRDRAVDVHVTNGTVDVADFEENINVKTTNGRVTIENIKGEVDVRNTNGMVSLYEIDGNVEAVTTNGRVSATNLGKHVTLKTTNGAVDVDSSQISGIWDLKTTNGNVTMRIPQDSDISFEGKTTNGSVDGDLDWIREKDEGFLGKFNEGSAMLNLGTHLIKAKGTNGSISVSFLQ